MRLFVYRRTPIVRRVVWLALLLAASTTTTVTAGAAGREAPARLWVASFHGPANVAQAQAIASSPDGSTVFVAGMLGAVAPPPTTLNSVLIAYRAANGARLWAVRSAVAPQAIAVSPDSSRVFVAADSWDGNNDIITVAFDAATGRIVWSKRYSGTGDGIDSPTAIAVGPDGRIYVAGDSCIASTARPCGEFFVITYSGSGRRLWSYSYGRGTAEAVATSQDGTRIYLTGNSWSDPATGGDCATVALRRSGVPVWTSRYHDPDGWSDGCLHLALSSDGAGLYVSGFTFDSPQWLVIAYDARTGAQRWVSLLDDYWAYAGVTITPDGDRLFVTGHGFDPETFFTTAYDAASGDELWRATGPSGYALASGVSPDGTALYMAGPGSGDFVTQSLDAASGAQLWVSAYGTPTADDSPVAMAVARDGGRIVVTGTTTNEVAEGWITSITTVAYAVG
jgi:outer membrane protein assembly factor BamB